MDWMINSYKYPAIISESFSLQIATEMYYKLFLDLYQNTTRELIKT